MDLIRSLTGMTELKVTSPDIAQTIGCLQKYGITIAESTALDEVTVLLRLSRRDSKKALALLKKRGNDVSVSGNSGIYWKLRGTLRRPVLVFGIVFLTLLSLYLPTRVLFVQVEGNETVPTGQILQAAEECGIYFGISARDVRSEEMKNRLLQALPGLRWAGINTRGCVAVITVREHPLPQDSPGDIRGGSIVAVRDGIIHSVTVVSGTALCTPGQAVRKGEMLISGYTDCGLCIRAEGAKGEVYADTVRTIRAVFPAGHLQIASKTVLGRKISLILGKKQINLWKDSGISDVLCGRMYEEYYVTLPGGFCLPVAVSVESYLRYETAEGMADHTEAKTLLSGFADSYLSGHMIAGKILSREEVISDSGGYFLLEGNYRCREMIGRVRLEKIGETYGKDD